MGFNIMLYLTVKKLDAFKFDGVAESDNTDHGWAFVLELWRLCSQNKCDFSEKILDF